MKVSYINPFVTALANVLNVMSLEDPKREKTALINRYPYLTGDINIVTDVRGDLVGRIIMTMSREASIVIARRITMEENIKTLDDFARGAFTGMTRLAMDNALMYLEDNGYRCEVAKPVFLVGRLKVTCPEAVRTLILPMTLSSCLFALNIALIEAPGAAPEVIMKSFMLEKAPILKKAVNK